MGRGLVAALLTLVLASCGAAQPSSVPLGGSSSSPSATVVARGAGVPQERARAADPAAPPAATAQVTTVGSADPEAAPAVRQKPRVGATSTRVTFMEFDLQFEAEADDGSPFSGDMKAENREELVYKITRVEDGEIAELELRYVRSDERMVGMGLDQLEPGPLHGKTYRVDARSESLPVYDTRRRLAPAEEAATVAGDAREFLDLQDGFGELGGTDGVASPEALEAARRLMQADDDVAIKNVKLGFRRHERTRSGAPTAVYDIGCDIAATDEGITVTGRLEGSIVLHSSPWRPHSVSMAGQVQIDGATDGASMSGRGRAKIELVYR